MRELYYALDPVGEMCGLNGRFAADSLGRAHSTVENGRREIHPRIPRNSHFTPKDGEIFIHPIV